MTASDHSEIVNTTAAANAVESAAAVPSPETAPTAEDVKASSTEKTEQSSSPEQQLAQAKKDAAEMYDRYVRSIADLENFRRRSVREKDELRQFAAGRVLEDLLPVLDNLGFGIAAAKAPNADLSKLVGGIAMVQEQLKTALSNHGLTEINPAGQKFDPNLHESIASQPSAELADGLVLQVVRVGYSLNGRLLRPASVIISSGPAKAGDKA